MNGVLPENRNWYRQTQKSYHFLQFGRLISLNERVVYRIRYQIFTFYSEEYFKCFTTKLNTFSVTPPNSMQLSLSQEAATR
jgi:hypothetical protein